LLLSDIRIDSISVVKCQHLAIIIDLLDSKQPLITNFRDIDAHIISLGESMYPTVNRRL
jgi:hypothetical protein